jgi:ribosomal-protein-alanine N-acetyltransferase
MVLPLITPMVSADLDYVMTLERQCFKDPWTRRMYLADLTQNAQATYLVARSAPSTTESGNPPSQVPPVLAYGGFWLLVDEAHVATIATHPGWRGCGLGVWLMLALLDHAMARGAVLSTLEVRAGNLAARRLYEKLGYQVVGMRRHYYRDGEDALIMTTPLLTDPAMQARLAAARAGALLRLERCFP